MKLGIISIPKHKIETTLCYWGVFIVFFSIPYLTCYILPHYAIVTGFLIVLYTLTIFTLYKKDKTDNFQKIILICLFSAIIHDALVFIFYLDEFGLDGIRRLIGRFTKYLFIITLTVLFKYKYNRFLNILSNLNYIIIGLSLLLFILLFIGIEIPYTEYSPDGRPHYIYLLGATNVVYHFPKGAFIRIAGLCDEPGQLALVITYLLVLNEFTFKKKAIRYFLSIGGLFTFSVAFYVTYFPFIIYWIKCGFLKIKSLLKVSLILLTIIVTITSLLNKQDKENLDLAVNVYVTERFTKNSDGKFQGDNRSSSIPNQIKAFSESPIIGVLGKGEKYYRLHNMGDPTYFSFLAHNGLFDFIYYLPFIYVAFLFINQKESILFLSIALNFLQRPGLEYMFFLVVISLIYYSRKYYIT